MSNLILNPHHHDVLSGRGNNINYHPGNQYFRNLVKALRLEYVKTPKPEKIFFGKLVVQHIQSLKPAGRFLQKDKDSGAYYELDDKKALDKTRQALREGAPELEKKIKAGEIIVPDFEVHTLIIERSQEVYKQTFPHGAVAPYHSQSSMSQYQSYSSQSYQSSNNTFTQPPPPLPQQAMNNGISPNQMPQINQDVHYNNYDQVQPQDYNVEQFHHPTIKERRQSILKYVEDFLPEGIDVEEPTDKMCAQEQYQSSNQSSFNDSASDNRRSTFIARGYECNNLEHTVEQLDNDPRGNYFHSFTTGKKVPLRESFLHTMDVPNMNENNEWMQSNNARLEQMSRDKMSRRRSTFVQMMKDLNPLEYDGDNDSDSDTFDERIDKILSRFSQKGGSNVDSMSISNMDSFAMDSLRMSLDDVDVSNHMKRMSVKLNGATRRSTRMSLALRQSLFSLDEDDKDMPQSNSVYIPDIFDSKRNRRGDTIVESSSQLLSAVYGKKEIEETVKKEPERAEFLLNSLVMSNSDADELMSSIREDIFSSNNGDTGFEV